VDVETTEVDQVVMIVVEDVGEVTLHAAEIAEIIEETLEVSLEGK